MNHTDKNTNPLASATEARTLELLREAGFDELVEGLWGKVMGPSTAYIEFNPAKRTALTWAYIPGEALFLGNHVTYSAPAIEQAVSAAITHITERAAAEANGTPGVRHAEPQGQNVQL